ncbi:MAG TPA: NADP-dependent oxidoreductase [Anaeromyxobacteraceae bacterium]|nr:NADP-dependent oxidoreductase [Anaeromyxobacteraceae bacterium]
MAIRNKQWRLASRPKGFVEESNFRLVEVEVPALEAGQLLVQIHYLSLDPYMRGRIGEAKSYAPRQPVGEVMLGGTVGEVIDSRNPRFERGDVVVGMGGWQQFHHSDGTGLMKVDARAIPASAYLGPVGMPGVTAWYGLDRIGKPRAGETVVVSAASGAVGSVAGQLAKLAGCRAVGIAGGAAKCDYVVRELGFDACVDYKADRFREALEAATPRGVDVAFENVGGPVLDSTLSRMNPFGRIAVCGLIAGYNGEPVALRNLQAILVSRLTVQGFIISEHLEFWPKALGILSALLAQGKLRYRETVAEGIESAPRALVGLFHGENLGKQLVKVA